MDDERRRRLEAIQVQVHDEVEDFLARHDVDQDPGFTEADLAAAVRNERFDHRVAVQTIRGLRDRGRVYREGGRWYVGRPPANSGVDQD